MNVVNIKSYLKKNPLICYSVAVMVFMGAVAGASSVHLDKTSLIFDNSFEQQRQTEADDVIQLLENMENGFITATTAKNEISDIKFYSKQFTSGSTVEMEVNKRYISFLNSAIDSANIFSKYGKDSKEFKSSFEIVKKNRKLI